MQKWEDILNLYLWSTINNIIFEKDINSRDYEKYKKIYNYSNLLIAKIYYAFKLNNFSIELDNIYFEIGEAVIYLC